MVDPTLKAVLQKKYGDEQTYVVPFRYFKKVPDKFSYWNMKKEMSKVQGKFILRSDAEYNDSVIQPIPYILVVNKNLDKIYVTKRIAGDARLKDSLALGCGGHINPQDANGSLILNAANRELNEELNIKLAKDTSLNFIGSVRDVASTTHEHLGIVMMAIARSVSVKEKDKLSGSWMSYLDLFNEYAKFESWARYIIDAMLINGGSIDSIMKIKY